jgi:putative SOS response-associated peptidase YedK
MCGRYALTNVEQLAERFKIQHQRETFIANTNINPGQDAPVIIRNDAGEHQLRLMRWGLVPPWVKEGRRGTPLINARAETVAEKPSFKHALRRTRCLVPATSFYEWTDTGNGKQPFAVSRTDGALFAFAGLYSKTKSPEGGTWPTFTIITTEPNDLVRPIHDRMPVILEQRYEQAWLDPSLTDPHILLSLLTPYPTSQMEMYPVEGRL